MTLQPPELDQRSPGSLGSRSQQLGRRIWESPTLTTWVSQGMRSGMLLLVTPLVLQKFAPAEVAVWYLFAGVIGLGALADFGFRGTFIRLFAFGVGGASDIGRMPPLGDPSIKAMNWALIERLYATMTRVYVVTTIGVIAAMILLGTPALFRPISSLPRVGEGWLAWALICGTTTIEFPGKMYKNYLDGLLKVALVRRVETLFRAGNILTALAVMVWAPSVLNLVMANRFWVVANVFRDRYLARTVYQGRLRNFTDHPFDGALFAKVWTPAWRGGISGLISRGLPGLTGVLYAQIGSPVAVASYLFALKLVSEIRDISNAPYYSKIPLMARLRAAGEVSRLVTVATRGMTLANIAYLLGVLIVGIFTVPLLALIGSNTPFVTPALWWLLAIAFLAHRIGVYHLQLYVTTNHVISHLVDGAAGAVFVLTVYLTLPEYGLYSFPIGMILGYLGIHAWVSTRFARMSLPITTADFALRFLALPFVLLTVLSAMLVVAIS
jgi:hypothetical protein